MSTDTLSTSDTTTPDSAEDPPLTTKQAAMWASGSYPEVAALHADLAARVTGS